ncbi:caspase family protein [Acidiphilium multivorum]|uniref:caspase family protein n=1 Tax=Acidiphilium multivorum TaxID=62140 RepID=UPI001F4C16E6|nr:caspase family protein [Acidiphilium multivorum]UNC15905.1 caspase family protein [Acidiphilium multivorum]
MSKLYKPQYDASHALIVGIDHYMTASPLSFAVNDANAVAQCLIKQFNFPSNNVHLLRDDEATRPNILKAFLNFANDSISPDDRIVFFFAGHGHTVSERRETGFLVPQDGNPDDLSTLIRWDEFTRNADLIPAKHMLFLMDACYGGLAVNRKWVPEGSKRFLGDLLQRYARQVLAAGKPDQPVSDGGGKRAGHSIFTSHLLDGLEGAAALADGLITGNSVMKYAYEKVGTDEYSQQTPHYGAFEGDGDFVFNPSAVDEIERSHDSSEGTDVLVDTPAPPDSEPPESQSLADTIRTLIPDPAGRIKLDTLVNRVLRAALVELGVNNFPALPGQGGLNEQFALRVRRYDELLVDLETVAVLLAHWGDVNQGHLLAKVLTRMAEAERPQGGVVTWLHLMAYPVVAVMYAGGVAALAAGRYDMLHICLTTQVRWGALRSAPAAPILLPIINEITSIFNGFKALPGLEQKYVPRSEHQLRTLQPIVEDQLFLGLRYEDLFDQFEIMLALVCADLAPPGHTAYWGPPGRFAYLERSLISGIKPFSTFVETVRTQGQSWPGFAAGFFNGSLTRFEEVAQGYAELINTIGPVF